MFNWIHAGVPRLDFVHNFRTILFLRLYKIAEHFHGLAGRGTSRKRTGLSCQKPDGWQVCVPKLSFILNLTKNNI